MIIQLLRRETFKPYGDVVDCAGSGEAANQGTARRLNFLSKLVNIRTENQPGISKSLSTPPAELNVCLFRSQPAELPFQIKFGLLIQIVGETSIQ